jgi:hypothetical protein
MVMTTAISVFPNPFDRFIVLEIFCEEKTDCIILLADLTAGKILRMLGAGLSEGINRLTLDDLQTLSKGQYQLDVKTITGDTLYQTLLIKQ